MIGGFAIVPDTDKKPAALFTELEHAIEWAVTTLGSDAFSIRWMELNATDDVPIHVGMSTTRAMD